MATGLLDGGGLDALAGNCTALCAAERYSAEEGYELRRSAEIPVGAAATGADVARDEFIWCLDFWHLQRLLGYAILSAGCATLSFRQRGRGSVRAGRRCGRAGSFICGKVRGQKRCALCQRCYAAHNPALVHPDVVVGAMADRFDYWRCSTRSGYAGQSGSEPDEGI